MCDSIPINKLNSIIGENPLETLSTIHDLDTLRYFLSLHAYKVKTGAGKPINFPASLVLRYLNGNNLRIVCEVAKLGLSVQKNRACFKRRLSYAIRAECENSSGEIDFDYTQLEKMQDGFDSDDDFTNYGFLKEPLFKESIVRLNLLNVLLESAEDQDDLIDLGLGIDYFKNILELISNEFSFLFLDILPHYLRLFQPKCDIVNILWQHSIDKDNLCYVCTLDEEYLSYLFSSEDYWNFLQQHLCSVENNKYKTAVYLFRLSLNRLQKSQEFETPNKTIDFNDSNKITFFKSMELLCILLDVTWEKQLHLVEPSLLSLKSITCLHPMWLLLIYRMLLRHNHSSVVYSSVIIILQSQADFRGYLKDVLKLILNALNNAEYISLTKQAYNELSFYIKKLNQNDYESVLKESLSINWVPVGFWCVYKCLINPERVIPLGILNEIIRKAKIIPHKYIRKGCLDYLFNYIQKTILCAEIPIGDLIEILLEFSIDESMKFYTNKLINNRNLIVDKEMLELMEVWLNDEHVNSRKVDLIVEIVNRKNVPFSWMRDVIHVPFKSRKYQHRILDRLSYTYCVKTSELEAYLNERLNVEGEVFKICMIDKPRLILIDKCVEVLTSDYSSERQALAFEILFYANENRFQRVYSHWIDKIIYRKEKIPTLTAIGFVNLLSKIPLDYLRKHSVTFTDIMKVYELFFNTQPDEVATKIFRNIDVILERITLENSEFLGLCFTQLRHMRRSECFEAALRFFVRGFALSYEKINVGVAEFILRELFEFSKTSDTAVFYCCLYFKKLKFDLDVFPMHEYILFGSVFGRDDCAEYEICKGIYFHFFNINPSFRTAEIHKWTIENILSDVNEDRIGRIAKSLIEKYRIHFKKRYFPDSLVHLHKLRIMQTFSFIIPHMSDAARLELKELICESFREECHQASVRQLMQYLLLQLLKDDPKCLAYLLGMVERTGKTHTSTITGFIPVMYGLELLRNDTEFSISVVETILPWVMGAHFKLRLYSQLAIKKICDKNASNRKFKQKFDSIHRVLDSVTAQTPQIEESILRDLDLVKHIYLEKPHDNNAKLIHLVSVHIPETTSVTPIEWEYFKIKNSFAAYMKTNRESTVEAPDFGEGASGNVQKKIVPPHEFLSGPCKKGELILVTSLIESLANLGGLSRTCEIFGVEQMVVNNAKAVHEREFQNLSMSSEKWVNVAEVKIADLREFIVKCKSEGYECVGAEQTSDSIGLHTYKFPRKTLLLLGNERSGIPPNLIHILDRCVEIPQFGMVRSLNVHVAGAMFLWEYVKQHTVK